MKPPLLVNLLMLFLITLVIGCFGRSDSEVPLADPRIRITGRPNARYAYRLEQYGQYGGAGVGIISLNSGEKYIPASGIVEKALNPRGVGYYLAVAPKELPFRANGDANGSKTGVEMKNHNPKATFFITLLDGETVIEIKSTSQNRRRMAVIDYGEIPHNARPVQSKR